MNRIKTKVLPVIGHLLATVVLAIAFWSFVKGYLFNSIPSGSDYYTGLLYTEFFRKYLTWPPAGWENFWYSGISVFNGYPWPLFYLIQPLVRIVGSGWGMEIYSVIALFLFFVFAYLLFWELSRNRFFSLFLSLVLMNSFSVFNALPWNGFVTASAAQMFLPLVAWLIIRFYRTGKKKILVTAALMNGLAILIHPTNGLILIFVPCFCLLFFWRDEKTKFWSAEKVKAGFLFGALSFLVASAALYPFFSYTFAKSGQLHCYGWACRGRLDFLAEALNPLFYLLVILFLGAILLKKVLRQQTDGWKKLVFLVPLLYLLIFLAGEYTNLLEFISPLMWPERLIWAVGLLLGLVLAGFWPVIFQSQSRLFKAAWGLVFSGAILFLIFGPSRPFVRFHWTGPLVLDFSSLLAKPGVYPDETYTFAVDKYKTREVTTTLPAWLKPDDFNYRFDCLLSTINFWWNLGTAVPNTRGYVNLMRKSQSFFYGWLMSGLMNWWEEGASRSAEISQKTSQFLIDWYAIRYLEATFDDEPYADFILREPLTDQYEEIKRPNIRSLYFYRVNEENTSPIIKATQAKTMLVVGSQERYIYDNLLRVLAAENLNSQVLIPVRGPEALDELSKYQLDNFDLIFLSDYHYRQFDSWRFLADYVQKGGSLLIDTGAEVRESDRATLPEGTSSFPEVFPLKATKRDSLGTDWQLTQADHLILKGVDLSQFGPLLYQDSPWKLSFVPNQADLKEGATVLLSQRGYPVLVNWQWGSGKVIWNGLNLSYHFQSYDRAAEAKLLANMVSFLVGGLPKADKEVMIDRPRPEKVTVRGKDFNGVVFKEHFDPGWQASINGQKARIYLTGPDFMYVRVPRELGGEIKVEFFYRGTLDNWFFFLLSLGSIGLIIFYLTIGKYLKLGFFTSTKREIKGWWATEEE